MGANSVDFVYRLPQHPQPAGPLSKMRISGHERSAGGQMATALAACAALGLRTSYVGTISSGDNGVFVRQALTARGIDVSRAIVRDTPNAYAVILVAAQRAADDPPHPSGPRRRAADRAEGERIVLWDRPGDMTLWPEDVPAGLAASARLVHVDDVDPQAAIAAGRQGIAAGVPVTSDIEAARPSTPDLMEAVTVPIFAEHVPSELTGEPDVERALRALRQRHGGMLVVTRGPRGAAMLAGDRFIDQPAFAVSALDTTGAGDVFRAGFIYALLRGDAPDAILRFACAAAAVSCTRPGAIASVPSLAMVDAMLAS